MRSSVSTAAHSPIRPPRARTSPLTTAPRDSPMSNPAAPSATTLPQIGRAAYKPATTYGTPYNLPTTQLAQHTASTGSGIVIVATTGPASMGGPAPVTLRNNALATMISKPSAVASRAD